LEAGLHLSENPHLARDTSLTARCFRSFISDWFRVMRISQVENWDSSRN
jgi:hypothetical protein